MHIFIIYTRINAYDVAFCKKSNVKLLKIKMRFFSFKITSSYDDTCEKSNALKSNLNS